MKATVEQLRSEYAFSERHSCQLIGLAVSTYRYEPCKNDAPLREQLRELAQEKPRYGYRRLHVLLRRAGVIANHKRVWRVYHEAGLSVKRRKRKRLVRVGRPQEAVSAPNQEWALDFVSDRLATGRSVRVLSVVDAFTRECIALEADTSFASRRVTRVLEAALKHRAWPQRIRCDEHRPHSSLRYRTPSEFARDVTSPSTLPNNRSGEDLSMRPFGRASLGIDRLSHSAVRT